MMSKVLSPAIRRGLLILGILAVCIAIGALIALAELVPAGELADAARRLPVHSSLEAAPAWPADSWERAEEAEIRRLGWDMDKLGEAHATAERLGSAALMVVHHGKVIAAWGDIEKIRDVRSVRKSLLGGLIGNSIARGELALDMDLSRLLGTAGTDREPTLTESELRATLADLLTSRSGVYLPAAKETSVNAKRRPSRGSHAPGEHFYYNNWDFNALGTILERATGTGFAELFEREFATPLGMQDWDRSAQTYDGIGRYEHPAYEFRMSARDLARFGLVYARHGRWRDQQVVPEAWVKSSLEPVVDRGQGKDAYGYLWLYRSPTATVSEPIHYALGAGAQIVAVLQCSDIVIVNATDTRAMSLRMMLGTLMSDPEGWQVVDAVLAAAPRTDAAACPAAASGGPA